MQRHKMASNQQPAKSRVATVDCEETWKAFISEAKTRGCPVAVHFMASWCLPSIAMNPLFGELALRYHDIMFLVVDVDEVKEVAWKMEIKAMPSFVLMKEGIVVDKFVGANPYEIKKRVEALIINH